MPDTKYVCVIVDDFTYRALDYPKVELYDYGCSQVVEYRDAFYYDWCDATWNGAGTVDVTSVVSETYGYHHSSDFGSQLLDTTTFGPTYFDYDPYRGTDRVETTGTGLSE